MGFKLNPITGKLDLVNDTSSFVAGSGSGIDNRLARWDGATALQSSGIDLSDTDVMTWVTTGSTELELLNAEHNYSGTYAGTAASFGTIRLNYTGTDDEIYQDALIIEAEDSSTGAGNTTTLVQRGLVLRGGINASANPINGTATLTLLDLDPAFFGYGPAHVAGTVNVITIIQRQIANSYTNLTSMRLGSLWHNPIGLVNRNSIRFDATETSLGTTFIGKNLMSELQFDVDGVTVLDLASSENRSEVPLRVICGASTSYARAGGLLFSNVVSVAGINGQNIGHSHLMPTNSMNADGHKIVVNMSGTFAATASNKRLRIQLASVTFFDTNSIAHSGGSWLANFEYYYRGASAGAINGTLSIITGAGVRLDIGRRFVTTFSNTSFAVRTIMNGLAASDVTTDESSITIWNGV